MRALNTYCKMLLENTQYLPTCSLKKKSLGSTNPRKATAFSVQSVLRYRSCECIDSSSAFFLFKSNLDPSAFFSVLLKSLILIHEFTLPIPKQKGSPTPAATKQLRSGVREGQERTPPGGAAPRARGARTRRQDSSPRRTIAPEWPAPPTPTPTRPASSSGRAANPRLW